jgi:hypothetical protein
LERFEVVGTLERERGGEEEKEEGGGGRGDLLLRQIKINTLF